MRCDLHVHSKHSGAADLPVLRHVGRESYSEPLAVYERAMARGMDLVTLTDHDTIAGALELRHLPNVFVSEEVTVLLSRERQLHVNVFDLREEQHEAITRQAPRSRGLLRLSRRAAPPRERQPPLLRPDRRARGRRPAPALEAPGPHRGPERKHAGQPERAGPPHRPLRRHWPEWGGATATAWPGWRAPSPPSRGRTPRRSSWTGFAAASPCPWAARARGLASLPRSAASSRPATSTACAKRPRVGPAPARCWPSSASCPCCPSSPW